MTSYEFTHFTKMARVWKTKSLLSLKYDPLIVFRRQNHITFIFMKTMSHDLLVQMAYWSFLCFSLEAQISPAFQEMVPGRILHVFDHWVVCNSCKNTWLMVWDNILLFPFSQMISLLAQAGLLRGYLLLMIHLVIRDSVMYLLMEAKLTQTIAPRVQ